MKTRFFKALPILLYLFAINIVNGQSAKPLIDSRVHNAEVTQIEVSEDKKYFYTVDIQGLIGVWHLETGKLIRTHTQLQDKLLKNIQVEESRGELIVLAEQDDKTLLLHRIKNINSKNANSRVETVKLDKTFIDYQINPINKNIVICSGQESYNSSTRQGSNYRIQLLDEQFNQIYNKSIDPQIIHIHFLQQDKLRLIVDEKSDVKLSEMTINYKNDQVTLHPLSDDIKYSSFFKSQSTTIYGDKISFIDHAKKNQRHDTKNYPREFINNFKFSDDNKYVAIVGGSPSSFFLIPGHLMQEEGTGFVCLIDIKGDSILWQTTGKENQFNFNVKDIEWIDDKSFLAINYKGEVHYYDIYDNSYYQSVGSPQILPTTFDIDEEFTCIAFSKFTDVTGSFEIEEDSPMTLDTFKFQPKIEVANNGMIAGSKFLSKPNSIIDWSFSESEVLIPDPNFENIDLITSNSGRFFIYAYDIMHNYMYYNDPKTYTSVKTEDGRNIGFLVDSRKHFSENIFLANTNENSINLSLKNNPNIVIYDTQNSCDPITLLPDSQIENCQLSYEGKYLTYLNKPYGKEVFHSIFDLEDKKWIYINDDTSRKINHLNFDKHSNFATVLFADGEVVVWNLSNNEIKTLGTHPSFLTAGVVATTWNSGNSQIVPLEIQSSLPAYNPDNKKIILHPNHNEAFLVCTNGICSTNTASDLHSKIKDQSLITNLEFSPTKNYVLTYSKDKFKKEYISIYTYPQLDLVYKQLNPNQTGRNGYFASEFEGRGQPHYFHKTKDLILLNDARGKVELINLAEAKIAATLMILPGGEWLIYTPQGYFEGSKKGRQSLYYSVDGEIILYNQIKEKFWISNLLNKVINTPNLISYRSDAHINEFPPYVDLELNGSEGRLSIKNKASGVKLGKISLFINDKEIVEDINPQKSSQFVINLKDYENYLYAGDLNKISVKTYTSSGWLNSRHQSIYLDTNLAQSKGDGDDSDSFSISSRRRRSTSSIKKPGLYGLFVGTSIYDNESLNLQFADFDAKSLRDGFLEISENMYDANRTDLKLLTTGSNGESTTIPSKANILLALESINSNAKVDDIVVLFFSGHGKSIDEDFFYLTSEFSEDDIQNPEELRNVTISSQELKDALKNIAANKQLLILDACHSGQINKIIGEGGKATTTSQQKSLENLEDKTGVFILASSEGNQKSYEATSLQKGILTFSLLLGMSEVESENEIINVVDLLNYASKKAEGISKTQASHRQRPVLGISNGSNSFPIGIKSGNFMVNTADNKIRLSTPNFGLKTNNNDPLNIEKTLISQLRERGSFGTTGPFNYIEKSNVDAYKLVGFYEPKGSDIIVTWYIIKYNVGAIETMNLTKPKSEKLELINEIINISIDKIMELEGVDN